MFGRKVNKVWPQIVSTICNILATLKIDAISKTRGMIKIDACLNDYMLYWKNHTNDTSCHVCGTPRWIENTTRICQLEENAKAYKVSAKI